MSTSGAIQWGRSFPDYDEFHLKGVPFALVHSNFHQYETNEDRIVILKSKRFINSEQHLFDQLQPKNILELGLFEGGSAILWSLLYGGQFVGIDLRARPKVIDYWLDKLDLRKNVHLYYNTSQTDEEAIKIAVSKHFGNETVDLVIDDASHMYELSRRTFELCYPLLRTGGIYCLEDWGWAHFPGKEWQENHFWGEHKALTNLVFELTMLHASAQNVFQSIYMLPFACFCYSSGAHLKKTVSLDKLIAKQDRKFVPI